MFEEKVPLTSMKPRRKTRSAFGHLKEQIGRIDFPKNNRGKTFQEWKLGHKLWKMIVENFNHFPQSFFCGRFLFASSFSFKMELVAKDANSVPRTIKGPKNALDWSSVKWM